MYMNQFEWELDPFVQQAMSIAHNREQPISVQKQNFENLLSAVYEYTRQKVEAQINEEHHQKTLKEFYTPTWRGYP